MLPLMLTLFVAFSFLFDVAFLYDVFMLPFTFCLLMVNIFTGLFRCLCMLLFFVCLLFMLRFLAFFSLFYMIYGRSVLGCPRRRVWFGAWTVIAQHLFCIFCCLVRQLALAQEKSNATKRCHQEKSTFVQRAVRPKNRSLKEPFAQRAVRVFWLWKGSCFPSCYVPGTFFVLISRILYACFLPRTPPAFQAPTVVPCIHTWCITLYLVLVQQ